MAFFLGINHSSFLPFGYVPDIFRGVGNTEIFAQISDGKCVGVWSCVYQVVFFA